MAEMVAGIFVMGSWKSLDELEDSITMQELQLLMDAKRRDTDRRERFQAALKGIELPDDEPEEETGSWEEAQAKAEALLAGKSEEEVFFEDLGVDFVMM